MKFLQYLKDFLLIKKSRMFDRNFYLSTYKANDDINLSPIFDYISKGWQEGKNPSAEFNTTFYLYQYPDVYKSEMNPLVHYIRFGKYEGRTINPRVSSKYKGYTKWLLKYDTLTENDCALIDSHIKSFQYLPKISILMTVTNSSKESLQVSIKSILAQIYPEWELCLVCNSKMQLHQNAFLRWCQEQNPRIILEYLDAERGYPEFSNLALEMCSGEFFCRLEPSDRLSSHALYLVANELNDYPQADVIYSDEDQFDQDGERINPFFKPDWNPELFKSHNLLNHLGVFRTSVARQLGGYKRKTLLESDWDLAYRIIETIPESHIHHIKHICYYQCQKESLTWNNTENYSQHKESQKNVLIAHFKRTNKDVEVLDAVGPYHQVKYSIPEPKPLVSIIIPTKNQTALLKACLSSIEEKTHYSPYEIILVNNQSDDSETLNYLRSLENLENISVLDYDAPFNYSAINNFAARYSHGDVLMFLNDDIEVISTDWLEEMVGYAIRNEIGAVGAMLYFPNNSIQHAGIILYPEIVAGHAFYRQARGSYGQNDRARLVQNYSAVTAACMAIEKSNFLRSMVLMRQTCLSLIMMSIYAYD